MEVQSGLIFVGIVAAAIVGTGATGLLLGFLLYQADRQVRAARLNAVDIATQRGSTAALSPLPLAPATEYLLSRGKVEAPPTLGLNNTKLGMWVFLASEVIFFTGLIATFVTFKFRGFISDNGLLKESVVLVAVNTFILLSSSFTVVLGLENIQSGKRDRFLQFMALTALLGATFVGLQGVEWTTLIGKGITPTTSLFGTSFFVTTGFHGMHVLIGVIWLISLIARAKFRGEFTTQNNLGYELFGLYWHFVDIVWIVLFTVIYLI